MDLVTKNLVKSFQDEESLQDEDDQAVLFEHFANYCVVANEFGDEFDVEDIHTGGGNDLGIDGMAILVNGALITDMDEVEDLAAANKFLDVHFIFCQAKSGSGFNGTEISNFTTGIKQVFDEDSAFPKNEVIVARSQLVQAIYSKSPLFKRGNPRISMYFVTNGKWQDDPALIARITNEKTSLAELDIFSTVDFHPVDARALQDLFKRAKNRLEKTIEFANKLTMPAPSGVKEAYLGYVPALEYLKLVTDDSGTLLKGIFYDNVRDFQGENPVNVEIAETLTSDWKDLFALMNNGVTIVAGSLNKTGDTFTIGDYQIVNGCQTSHVLFNVKDDLDNSVHIPLRLMVSQDAVIRNRVIKATNSQTPVKTEELTSLTDFQKALEDYYSALDGDSKLYYERRSQQYRSTAGIEKIRIVTVSNQIRSFASMFLALPHQASRYYGTLLKTTDSKIFVEGQPPNAYYASALALYRVDAFIRKKVLDGKYRPFKYHLLALLRGIMVGNDMPAMNSNKFEKYCDTLIQKLQDETGCLSTLNQACAALDTALGGNYERDGAKDASLLEKAIAIVAAPPPAA